MKSGSRNRKTLVIALSFLALVLVAISIFIGVRVYQLAGPAGAGAANTGDKWHCCTSIANGVCNGEIVNTLTSPGDACPAGYVANYCENCGGGGTSSSGGAGHANCGDGVLNGYEWSAGGNATGCDCVPGLDIYSCRWSVTQMCNNCLLVYSPTACANGVDDNDTEDALSDCADPACHIGNDLNQACNQLITSETNRVVRVTPTCSLSNTIMAFPMTFAWDKVGTGSIQVRIDNDNNWSNGYWYSAQTQTGTTPISKILSASNFTPTGGATGTFVIPNAGAGPFYAKTFFSQSPLMESQVLTVTPAVNCAALTQCNDGVDNVDAEDTLIDCADPGCHAGGLLTNACDPTDDDESNAIADPACNVCTPGLSDGNAYTSGIQAPSTCLAPNAVAPATPTACPVSACSDGIDNSDTEDTLIDCADPGCHPGGDMTAACDPTDNDEANTVLTCYTCTTVLTDSATSTTQTTSTTGVCPGGSSQTAPINCPQSQCSNGSDDDSDGLVDCADAGCHAGDNLSNACDPADDTEASNTTACYTCTAAINDGNTYTQTTTTSTCPVGSTTTVPTNCNQSACSNGVDNDGDTLIDCADPGCHVGGNINAACDTNDDDETNNVTQCNDGVDNADPEDALADCADPGCHVGNTLAGVCDPDDNTETNTATPSCSNSSDDDGDGLIDCGDPGCHTGNTLAGACNPNDDSEFNAPDTAIFSDTVDVMILGTVMLILGFVIWRYGFVDNLLINMGYYNPGEKVRQQVREEEDLRKLELAEKRKEKLHKMQTKKNAKEQRADFEKGF